MTTELSAQQVFNKVTARLRDGTGPARDLLSCRYLTREGNKCAVGIFIPDGHRGQSYEGGISSLLRHYPDLRTGPIGQHKELLAKLQNTHDNMGYWNETIFVGEFQLRAIAESHGLEYTPPKQFS